MSNIKVNFIAISNERAILKGEQPLFPDMLSSHAFCEYLKLGEHGNVTATVVSDKVIELHTTDNTNLIDMMQNEIPQMVRMPPPEAISLGVTNERDMFLYWNIHEYCNDWNITYL